MTVLPPSRAVAAAGVAVLALSLSACGSSSSGSGASGGGAGATPTKTVDPNAAEVSPAGDIPDDQAYVRYAMTSGGFSVKVPEGWARSSTKGGTRFTDKLNAIELQPSTGGALTAAAAKATEVPRLEAATPGFASAKVSTVRRTAGSAVRITYLATAPADPVTGKRGTDAVERYVFSKGTRRATLILSGPKGADNVDPWKIVTDAFRWTR
ncbi:hypothetical protein [Patulibacter minatonensis]|uniref:hypothetical protein n=1 Tax=Patulibacter minatonensis TaxID=298163 RepID=UPI00047B96D2|nr:hypothetical protein [Patulibacter minatonensis]